MAETFAPGDRVSTNTIFAKKFPKSRSAPLIGTVVAPVMGRPTRFNVLWDSRKHPEIIHHSFLKMEGEND